MRPIWTRKQRRSGDSATLETRECLDSSVHALPKGLELLLIVCLNQGQKEWVQMVITVIFRYLFQDRMYSSTISLPASWSMSSVPIKLLNLHRRPIAKPPELPQDPQLHLGPLYIYSHNYYRQG